MPCLIWRGLDEIDLAVTDQGARRDPVMPPELPDHVALIAKAGGNRRFRRTHSIQQQLPSEIDTALQDMRVRCHAGHFRDAAHTAS